MSRGYSWYKQPTRSFGRVDHGINDSSLLSVCLGLETELRKFRERVSVFVSFIENKTRVWNVRAFPSLLDWKMNEEALGG